MLTSMRKHSKFLNIFLWLVIIAFLATIFVVWGVGEKQAETNYAARVDDQIITYNDYRNAYENRANELRANFGDQADQIIKDSSFSGAVLESIVNTRLLLLEADRLKIPVSDAEVAAYITNDPSFMTNNVFDPERYQQILINVGYRSPSVYENEVKNQIRLNKLQQMLDGSMSVSDDEIKREYIYTNTKISASYFTVNDSVYQTDIVPNEADLAEYFAKNQEKYRLPVRIKLKYTSFSMDNFSYTSDITDQAVRERYTATITNYTEPESLMLSHISGTVTDWDNATEVKDISDRIDRALAELKQGTGFADVAVQYNDDRTDGYIGQINGRAEGEMTPLEKQIFALESGGYTDVIRDDNGFHIYKADNHTPEKVRTFEEVRDEIRAVMDEDAKRNAYRNHIYAIYRDVLATGNLTAYLVQNPGALEVQEAGTFSEDDPQAFFQADPDLKSNLFSVGETEITPLIDFRDSTYIYEIEDRENSRIPALDEVRSAVITDWRADASFNSALADVNSKVTADTASAEDFKKAADLFGVPVSVIPAFRRDDVLPDVLWARDLATLLFKGNKGDIVKYPAPEGAQIYVLRIDEVILPSEENLAQERDTMYQYLLSTKRTDAYAALVKSLKAKHNVIINPNIIN